MNNRFFHCLLALLWIGISAPTHAGLVLEQTRVIYSGEDKQVTLQVINEAQTPALMQAWIDDGAIDSTPETTQAPFIVLPPLQRIDAKNGVALTIKFYGAPLVIDRESIFYLNVLDIPVKSPQEARNILQFAVRNRIKVFYRPPKLSLPIADILSRFQCRVKGAFLMLSNQSPYFLTISSLQTSKGDEVLPESVMIAPFTTQQVAFIKTASLTSPLSLYHINDTGRHEQSTLTCRNS